MTHAMQPIGFSPDDCIRNLRSYSDQFDELTSLFDDKGYVAGESVERAQVLLQRLKASLKNDYQCRATNKGQAAMSDVERAFFFPAIHEASTRIYVKTNSRPSPTWRDELADAHSSIQHYLRGLERNAK
jgi:hypothetical protein